MQTGNFKKTFYLKWKSLHLIAIISLLIVLVANQGFSGMHLQDIGLLSKPEIIIGFSLYLGIAGSKQGYRGHILLLCLMEQKLQSVVQSPQSI